MYSLFALTAELFLGEIECDKLYCYYQMTYEKKMLHTGD